ncbi:hypothetical protein Tco_1355478 [Tanacetum coccineum]
MFAPLTTPHKICNTGALGLSNPEVFPVRQRLMIVASDLHGCGFGEIEAMFIKLTAVSIVFVKSDGVPELLDVNGWNGRGSGEGSKKVGVLQDVHGYLEYGIGGAPAADGTSGALTFTSAIVTAHIHQRRYEYR